MTFSWSAGQWSFAKDFHTVTFRTELGEIVGYLTFQDGPITDHGENGTTNEQVIESLLQRLNALNMPPYQCRENSLAITHLETALLWLKRRSENRTSRGVEGTSTP